MAGVNRGELLVQGHYVCSACRSDFCAASDIAMAKLPEAVQHAFPFVLTEKFGVTKEYVVFRLHADVQTAAFFISSWTRPRRI